jgi:4'-phosphopantetheinyl transferase
VTTIAWLTCEDADVPPGDGWLGPAEVSYLASRRFPKRRSDWRLGRWTAKQALRAWLEHPPEPFELEIIAARDGAPEAWCSGRALPLLISLSHRDGRAACVVAPPGVRAGCDLETVEERSQAFLADYFTPGELAQLQKADPRRRTEAATVIWSAKESALKALRTGLRRDTRSVEVRLDTAPSSAAGWRRLQVADRLGGETFPGWWRRTGAQVLSVVAEAGVQEPRRLASRPNREGLETLADELE